jgi:membrane-bound lytic murein transglycosylase D
MKRIGLILAISILFSGCALLKPQHSETEPKIVSAITDIPLHYSVLGDASFPAHHYEPITISTQVSNPIREPKEILAADANIDEMYPAITLDLWERIRSGFTLPVREHKRIDQQLSWYARHQEYLDRVADRATPYMYYIVEELEKNNIPMEIALLPIVESAFKPFAYSHGRASGIWQFIPSTGRLYGLKQDWWYDGRRDVYESTQAAIRLLTALHKEFNGDWLHALAAYNSGSGNVRKAIRRNLKRGKSTDFFALDLPRETEAYVPKLLALAELVADPAAHGIRLSSIPNKPYFEKVDIGSQIDLALVAELAEMPLDDVYHLNPAYNRWATSPNGPHHLLFPLNKATLFKVNLEKYPPEKRIQWVRHRIRSGETIITIASKYNTDVATIKRVNRIRGSRLRAGHHLTIPVASKSLASYRYSANQRKQTQQNIPRKGIKVTHIVQTGDTFWELAQRHNVGVRSLAKWNSMAPRDPLVPGQKLVIWSRNNGASLDDDTAYIKAPPRRSVTQRVGYRVRRGDSLTRIAQKFNVSVQQLLQWNKKVSKSKYLQPGQRLTVYVDVTRTSS